MQSISMIAMQCMQIGELVRGQCILQQQCSKHGTSLAPCAVQAYQHMGFASRQQFGNAYSNQYHVRV